MSYDVCDNELLSPTMSPHDREDWVFACGGDLVLRASFQRGVTVIAFCGQLTAGEDPLVAESLEPVAEVGLARVLLDVTALTVARPGDLAGLSGVVDRVRQGRGVCAIVGLDPALRRSMTEGWPGQVGDDQMFDTRATAFAALMQPWPEGAAARDVLVAELAQLRRAMETRATIEQAKGILMAQRRCGAEDAFDVLVQASRRTNTKLATLAASLVEHTAQPHHGRVGQPVPADGHSHNGRPHDGREAVPPRA